MRGCRARRTRPAAAPSRRPRRRPCAAWPPTPAPAKGQPDPPPALGRQSSAALDPSLPGTGGTRPRTGFRAPRRCEGPLRRGSGDGHSGGVGPCDRRPNDRADGCAVALDDLAHSPLPLPNGVRLRQRGIHGQQRICNLPSRLIQHHEPRALGSRSGSELRSKSRKVARLECRRSRERLQPRDRACNLPLGGIGGGTRQSQGASLQRLPLLLRVAKEDGRRDRQRGDRADRGEQQHGVAKVQARDLFAQVAARAFGRSCRRRQGPARGAPIQDVASPRATG